jgi:hypothetical protein
MDALDGSTSLNMRPTTVDFHRDEWTPGTARWICVLAVLLLVEGSGASFVKGQQFPDGRRDSPNLISRYRMARYRLLVQKIVARMPMRTLPPESLPTPVDSLFGPPDSTTRPVPETTAGEALSFPVEEVRRVRRLERSWFRNRFGDTEWSFLGSSSRMTILDTTHARDLRARLQAHFGDPTFTPAEVDLNEWARRPDSTREGLVQFAYWFVVNDSIPVRVTDGNGPDERGLVVSTDRAHRDRLMELRSALLHPLRREKRSPYVDYFYEDATRRWYRVGFDGQSFFREHISRRDIVRGRRPRLDTVRSDPSSAPSADSAGTAPDSPPRFR